MIFKSFLWSHRYLIGIFTLFVIVLGIRIDLYDEPLFYDYARNALATIRITEDFFHSIIFQPHPQAGPFFAILAQPFNILTDHNDKYVLFGTQASFVLILFLSLYKLVERLHSQKAAVLSVLILTCFPIFFGQSMVWLHDIPHAAMVTAAMYLALVPETFRSKLRASFFGITVACGILTRFTYPVFVLAGFTIIGIDLIISTKPQRFFKTREFKNICIAFGIVLLIAAPWIARNSYHILINLYQEILHTDKDVNAYQKSGLEALLYYPSVLWVAIGAHWTLPFLVSCYSAFKLNAATLCIIATIAFPLVVMGFMPVTGMRYIMPVLPFIAAITAIGFSTLLDYNKYSKVFASCLLSVLIVFSFYQHYKQAFLLINCEETSSEKMIVEEPAFRANPIWDTACNFNVTNINTYVGNSNFYIRNLWARLPDSPWVDIAFISLDGEPISYLRSQMTYLLLKRQLLETTQRFKFIDEYKGNPTFDILIGIGRTPDIPLPSQLLDSNGHYYITRDLQDYITYGLRVEGTMTYDFQVEGTIPWYVKTLIVNRK